MVRVVTDGSTPRKYEPNYIHEPHVYRMEIANEYDIVMLFFICKSEIIVLNFKIDEFVTNLFPTLV